MNLQDHYAAYCADVKRDALDNYIEYARITPTQHPQQYPTIYDYMIDIVAEIRGAIANDDRQRYLSGVAKHEHAMRALFHKMSKEMLLELHVENTPQIRAQMAKEFGEKWVKFLDVQDYSKPLWGPDAQRERV